MIDEADPVPAQLGALGYPDAHWLAAGMEADVYALDEQTVARLPREAAAAGAGPEEPVERLLEQLNGCWLPFAVPALLGRLTLPDGRCLLRQPRLRGRSIGDFYDPASGHLDPRAEQALIELLSALRTIPHPQRIEMPDLPILGDSTVTTAQPWAAALQRLLEDRTRRFGGLLQAHVDRLDDLVESCDAFLVSRRDVAVTLQHGDICPENVLVDDDCRLTAVLDWGFLTMLADPVLEIALTAGFFDMYGPHALRTDRRLSDLFVEAFDVERADILRFKAVYALIGANAYSGTADGHFQWCAAVLRRPDVRSAVLL
ncbi:phosphotransferase family protein [Kineococcus radiotolerans]|uniref:Aminoglycoside phosphotransferase n=1 Tax=Kineococcus radiotolerans (strain ATCC BAA-149 / DSM 14245 / SRS30216) TaxID=266940 RepID=A6WAK1_KINRD|nr:aminoglycoside phosphotransferase family protein [Kineococcus radiotolerans]ABS03840.1 aminoglycoside phosphotransferase [Kineococcus radiotolerans SRS30216 = ATCC BAA-149]